MARSTPAGPTPISTRRPETNSQALPALPTISKISARSTETASISTSTGARRTSSPSRFSSALPDYAYQQVTDDSGQNPMLGGFRSRVLGVGPQVGYIFPLGDVQGFLGLRAYGDFDAANRAPGWSTWLTFAISPAAPTAVTPTRHLVTK